MADTSYGSGTGSSRGSGSTSTTIYTGTRSGGGTIINADGTTTRVDAQTGNEPTTGLQSTGKRYNGFVDSPSYVYTDSTGRKYTYGPRNTTSSYGRATATTTSTYSTNNLNADWQKFITAANASIDAVNVAYTGTTDNERLTFLQKLRTAIITRGQFIQQRVTALTDSAKAKGVTDEEYKTYFAYWSTAASLIPGAGIFAKAATAIANYVLAQDATESKERAVERIRQLVTEYEKDYTALAKLLKEVDTEGEKLAATLNTTYEAPTTGLAWYWWVSMAVGVFLVLYFWKQKSKPKRK